MALEKERAAAGWSDSQEFGADNALAAPPVNRAKPVHLRLIDIIIASAGLFSYALIHWAQFEVSQSVGY